MIAVISGSFFFYLVYLPSYSSQTQSTFPVAPFPFQPPLRKKLLLKPYKLVYFDYLHTCNGRTIVLMDGGGELSVIVISYQPRCFQIQ